MRRETLILFAVALLLATGCGTGTGGPLITFPPTLTSVSPSIGLSGGGTPLTLTGTNFAALSTVTVGGLPCLGVTVDPSGTSLTCTTPPGQAGTTNDVTISTLTGSDTLTDAFTYINAPKPTPPLRPVVDVFVLDAQGLPLGWWPDVLGSAASAPGGCNPETQDAAPGEGAYASLAEAGGYLIGLDPALGVLAWYDDPAALALGEPPLGCVFDERLLRGATLHAAAR